MWKRARKSKIFGYGPIPELKALPEAVQRGISLRAAMSEDVLEATFNYYECGNGFLGLLVFCGACLCVINQNLAFFASAMGVGAGAAFIFLGVRHYYCQRAQTLFRMEALKLIAKYLAGDLNPVIPDPPPKPGLPPRPVARKVANG